MTKAKRDKDGRNHNRKNEIEQLEAALKRTSGELLVCVVLDMSGSMEVVWDETIEVFNEYVKGLRAKPGPTWLSLIMFDDEYLPQYFNRPVVQVPALSRHTYVPRGRTALLDAMARCITETAALAHRPERVMVVTITDGHENASREFTNRALKKLVRQQQAEGWEFLYLSAAIDAFADAQRMGIAEGRMLKFSRNRSSMQSMKSAMDRATDLYGTSGASDMRILGYTDDVADVPEEDES